MTKSPFSDMFLRKITPPSAGRMEYYDGKVPGFGVRVAKGGRKTFFVVGRQGKAFRRVSLGHYPEVTLEKARRKAQDTLRALEDGTNHEVADAPQAETPILAFATAAKVKVPCSMQREGHSYRRLAAIRRSIVRAPLIRSR